MNHVTVIGAGLAGSECAWQLAQRGISIPFGGTGWKTPWAC